MKKTTSELLEQMKNYSDYAQYLSANREEIPTELMKLSRALGVLLANQNKRKSEVIKASGIEPHYAYQIFSGDKMPTRDKVVQLCYGFGMTPEEANRFLKLTGYAQLYGKDARDNVLLFGLMKRMTVNDVNIILYDLKYEPLT